MTSWATHDANGRSLIYPGDDGLAYFEGRLVGAATGGLMSERMRIFTIPQSALMACPETIILPGHYRADGTCLHALREREPVIYESDERDDGPREYYTGSHAVIIGEADQPPEDFAARGLRYIIEFESGSRLDVSMTELRPVDGDDGRSTNLADEDA